MFNLQCAMFNVKAKCDGSGPASSTSPIAHRTSHRGIRGFTLTELLVVIGIISLLMAVGLPAVKAMFASSQTDSAYTLVSTAVSAARTYAPRRPNVGPDLNLDGMGAAAVFMRNDDGQIEIHITQHRSYSDATASTPITAVYRDVIDPVTLGNNVGVVGISQSGSGTELIVPPPRDDSSHIPPSPYGFVIRFDLNGVLIARKSTESGSGISEQRVFYNIYPSYSTTSDPKAMDGCIGVIIYDAKAFADAGNSIPSSYTLNSSGTAAAYNWITSNGTAMLFNRYTGAVMKEQ